ncbi:MAG: hypothetical protein IPG81_14115 [Sandaracinaceae bacterium]|nr:hypothetical protein [Sandaracinaceae bacterium]
MRPISPAVSEEQYNIKHLGDLWLNCLDALSDALEAEGNKQQSDALDAAIERPSQLTR